MPVGYRLTRVPLCLATLVATLACGTRPQMTYPEARRVDQVDVLHGTEVADPYRWMEDLESPELHTWMAAQDSVTLGYLADQRDLIRWIADRTRELSNYARVSSPTVREGRSFFTRRAAGEAFGEYLVEEAGEGRRLLDLEALNAGGDRASVTTVSPRGRFVTVGTVSADSPFQRWRNVRVLAVEDGEFLPETLTGSLGGGSIAWTHDEAGFYYQRHPVPADPQAPVGRPAIYYHRVGTGQDADRLVFERPGDPDLSFGLRVSRDGRYLVVSASASGGSFNGMWDRLFYLDHRNRRAGFREPLAGIETKLSFEGSRDGRFFVRTSLDAPRMRLVAVDLARPAPAHWEDIVPEGEHTMRAVSEIADRLVVRYGIDARAAVRVYDLSGGLIAELDPLVPAMGGFADDPSNPVTYYTAPQLYDPGTVYTLDVRTGESTLHFRPELAHDPDRFTTTQVFYQSRDGTRVPMFLTHRKDIELDGTNPVFMYGYGVWAWSAFPWQGYMMAWMELGGVYAVANVRGGGEYGEAWHEAGMRHNKQNTIDDFIAGAEYLIEHGWTSPGRMIANGGSASGILPAASMIQRPDLFGATVINIPSLDQVRFTRFGTAASWIPEYGDPANPEDFEVLYAYSPYHRLEAGTCYPPTWIQVGERDGSTTPMHGYKFAAALQATQTAAGCRNPALLKIAWGAGHSSGLTPEQARESQAESLAFLVKTLGLPMDPAP